MLRGSDDEAAVVLRALRGLVPLGAALGGAGSSQQARAAPAAMPAASFAVIVAAAPSLLRQLAERLSAWHAAGAGQPLS